MSETFPAGVLRNTTTNRFHPIVFYPSPRPSEAGDLIVRHRSKGHHTAGFDTMDEAIAFIAARPTWRHTRLVWAWDGEGTPALTFSFPLPDDGPKLTTPQANALRAIAASEHSYTPLMLGGFQKTSWHKVTARLVALKLIEETAHGHEATAAGRAWVSRG